MDEALGKIMSAVDQLANVIPTLQEQIKQALQKAAEAEAKTSQMEQMLKAIEGQVQQAMKKCMEVESAMNQPGAMPAGMGAGDPSMMGQDPGMAGNAMSGQPGM